MSAERLEIDVERATGGEAAYDSGTINFETMDDGEQLVVLRRTRWDGVLDGVLARARIVSPRARRRPMKARRRTTQGPNRAALSLTSRIDAVLSLCLEKPQPPSHSSTTLVRLALPISPRDTTLSPRRPCTPGVLTEAGLLAPV